MKKTANIVSAILKCTECDWSSQDYRVAEHSAQRHVADTDHKVIGELGLAVTYTSQNQCSTK